MDQPLSTVSAAMDTAARADPHSIPRLARASSPRRVLEAARRLACGATTLGRLVLFALMLPPFAAPHHFLIHGDLRLADGSAVVGRPAAPGSSVRPERADQTLLRTRVATGGQGHRPPMAVTSDALVVAQAGEEQIDPLLDAARHAFMRAWSLGP